MAKWSPPVFEPSSGAPDDWDILTELAARMARRRGRPGVAAALRAARALGLERSLDLGLRTGPYGMFSGQRLSMAKLRDEPHGVDLGALRPCLPLRLQPRDRAIDFAPAPIAGELGRLRGTLAAPVPSLVLIGRRDLRSNNSWMHNAPSLVKGPARCVLLVHPDDARAHGLADGALVRLRSHVGEVFVPARLTDEMMPGVVSLPHGWGHDAPGARLSVAARSPGANMNLLTDPAAIDPLSGTAVLNGVPVTISPA